MAKLTVAAPKNKTIPDGETIRFIPFEVTMKEGKKGPYLNWVMLVHMEGTPYHDMKIWHITSLAATATFGLVRLLDAVGAPYEIEGENISFDTDDVIGKPFEATVKNEEYNGQTSTKIDKILLPETDAA